MTRTSMVSISTRKRENDRFAQAETPRSKADSEGVKESSLRSVAKRLLGWHLRAAAELGGEASLEVDCSAT